MALTTPKTVLLLTVVLALYTMWFTPYQNGLLGSLIDLQQPGSYLPGSKSLPIQHHYTGISVLDNQIVLMVGLFWPALDGSRADVSLAFLEIMTQAPASWVLATVESLRVGNKGKWYLTSITIAGILMQNIGYGLVMPLWAFLHLAHATTVNPSSAALLASSNPLPLLTLPLSTTLAFFVPNILMALPTPHSLSPSHFNQQSYIALAHFWPLLLAVYQLIFPTAISVVTPGVNALTEHDKKVKSLKYLRRCYAFTLIITGASHLVVVGIPLLASSVPLLLSPAYLPQLQFASIFLPTSPLEPIQPILSVADGALAFLKWDFLLGALSVLFWALTLRVQAQGREFRAYEWLEGLVKVAGMVAVTGPAGAAVAVIWARDEMVFERDFKEGARKSV